MLQKNVYVRFLLNKVRKVISYISFGKFELLVKYFFLQQSDFNFRLGENLDWLTDDGQ